MASCMFFAWMALAAVTALVAENPYAGSAACRACHSAYWQKQSNSHHANALRRTGDTVVSKIFPEQPILERNGTGFEYRLAGDGMEVIVRQKDKSASAILEWVFGAGALALTPVGRNAGGYFEHRVSWYAASQRPGMTLGHAPQAPKSPDAALGRKTKSEEITRCFNCHAAGVRPGPDLQWMQPGVQCERCHGPGATHVKTAGKADIVSNRAANAVDQVAFCAQCHRSPAESLDAAPEQSDPMLIRFAPVGLVASQCFKASAKLMCLTCHDPHEDARREAAFYSAKCQSCHEQKPAAGCAFEKEDCLSCHMRKSTPVKDLTFTDHRIRIYSGKK